MEVVASEGRGTFKQVKVAHTLCTVQTAGSGAVGKIRETNLTPHRWRSPD